MNFFACPVRAPKNSVSLVLSFLVRPWNASKMHTLKRDPAGACESAPISNNKYCQQNHFANWFLVTVDYT